MSASSLDEVLMEERTTMSSAADIKQQLQPSPQIAASLSSEIGWRSDVPAAYHDAKRYAGRIIGNLRMDG